MAILRYCPICGRVPTTDGRCPICCGSKLYTNRDEYYKENTRRAIAAENRRVTHEARKRKAAKVGQRVLAYAAFVLIFFNPYLTLAADRLALRQRGYIGYGGEVLVPIIVTIAAFLLFNVAHQLEGWLLSRDYDAKYEEKWRSWTDGNKRR